MPRTLRWNGHHRAWEGLIKEEATEIIAAASLVCAIALASSSYLLGKHDGRKETQIEAEKNNASFRKLPDRDRCLVFMRDSGLPDSACD